MFQKTKYYISTLIYPRPLATATENHFIAVRWEAGNGTTALLDI